MIKVSKWRAARRIARLMEPSAGPDDRIQVNVNEPYQVKHWMKELRCTEEALKRAVARVGARASDVRREIAGSLG
jgi:hypothetical protein